MIRSCLVVMIAVCGLLNNAGAQVKIVHNPQYKAGQKSKLHVEVNLEQTLTLNGMDLDSKVEQFMVLSNTVGKQLEDGKRPIDSHFEVLQSNLSLPGGLELQFDSGNADKQTDVPALEPIRKLFAASSRAKWQSIIGKDNRIESVKYTNDVFDSLDEALKKEVNPEKFKREGNQQIDALPREAVKKGDTWKRTEQVEFGNGQTFMFDKEYTYEGTAEVDGKTMDKISSKYLTVSYSVDANPQFQLMESELKPSSSKGTLLYDRELGIVTRSLQELRVKGTLKLSINGMAFDGKLDLTMKSSSKMEI